MSDFRIQVDSLVSSDGTGAVSAGQGLNLSGSPFVLQSNIDISGISTLGFVSTTNVVVGVVTSNLFSGDGSQLTGLPTFTASKIIAYKYILSDPPLRS